MWFYCTLCPRIIETPKRRTATRQKSKLKVIWSYYSVCIFIADANVQYAMERRLSLGYTLCVWSPCNETATNTTILLLQNSKTFHFFDRTSTLSLLLMLMPEILNSLYARDNGNFGTLTHHLGIDDLDYDLQWMLLYGRTHVLGPKYSHVAGVRISKIVCAPFVMLITSRLIGQQLQSFKIA